MWIYIRFMTTKTSWLCDAVGVTGACCFLYGVYIAYALAAVLMIGGLMLIGYAARLCYLDSQ